MLIGVYFLLSGILFATCERSGNLNTKAGSATKKNKIRTIDNIRDTVPPDTVSLDTTLYRQQMMRLVHNKPTVKWPPATPYPLPGAILPFKRIVAFYGNLYSKGMGILGELPPDQMLAKLQTEVKKWSLADTLTPVQPALHYIAVTAQRSPGPGGKYRLRMPFDQIDKILEIAKRIDAIVFLDIQVGHSTVQQEIPPLRKYLAMPNVHLGIDPEYSMKGGQVPATAIGTFNASDINYAAGYLVSLVKEYKIPPKILVVHRFTQAMVTDYKAIKTHPEVQIVINMDGFGSVAKKKDSYQGWITGQPVQFAGFKLFYKIDKPVMKPKEVLSLYPVPIYIQYQ